MDICQHTDLLAQSHQHQFDFPAREPNLVLSDKALDTHMTTVWFCVCLIRILFSFYKIYLFIV